MAAASTEGLVSLLRFSAFGGGILYGYAKFGHVVNKKRAALAHYTETKQEEALAARKEIASLKQRVHELENPNEVKEEADGGWLAALGIKL